MQVLHQLMLIWQVLKLTQMQHLVQVIMAMPMWLCIWHQILMQQSVV